MSAKIELCFFDLLSDSAITEDTLRIAFKNIVNSINPISINRRYEIEYYSQHSYCLSLILSNPNASDKLKAKCFIEMINLHRRLTSILQLIRDLEAEVIQFEKNPPIRKVLRKGKSLATGTPDWRANQRTIHIMKLKKACVINFQKEFSDSTVLLNICENRLPDTADAQVAKLLR